MQRKNQLIAQRVNRSIVPVRMACMATNRYEYNRDPAISLLEYQTTTS